MECSPIDNSFKPNCRLCERVIQGKAGWCYPDIHRDYPELTVDECRYNPYSEDRHATFTLVNNAMDEHLRLGLNDQLARVGVTFKKGISPKPKNGKKSAYIPTTFANLYKGNLQAEGFIFPELEEGQEFDILDLSLPDGWRQVVKQEDKRYSIIHDARGIVKLTCFLCADPNNFACTCSFPPSPMRVPI